MNNLSPLISFWIILLAFGLYGVVHSILASLKLKAWVEGVFGAAWVGRWYRLIFNVLGVVTLVPIFWLMAVLPNQALYEIPATWRWLAILGQLFGLLVLLASVGQTGALDFLGLGQLSSAEGAEAPEFTDKGLYRWVRHPLYSGAMLFIWLSPRMSVNLAAFYAAISFYFWIGAYFEERKLARLYGQKYVDYQARLPMFVPGIGPRTKQL